MFLSKFRSCSRKECGERNKIMQKCKIDCLGRITIPDYMWYIIKFLENDILYIIIEKDCIVITKNQTQHALDICKYDASGHLHIPYYIALSKRLIDNTNQTWLIWLDTRYNEVIIPLIEEQAAAKITYKAKISELKRIQIPQMLRNIVGFSAGTKLGFEVLDNKVTLFKDVHGIIKVDDFGFITLPAEALANNPIGVQLVQNSDWIDMIKIQDIDVKQGTVRDH